MTYNAGKHIPQPSHMKCRKCKGESDKNSFSTKLNAALCKKCAKDFANWLAKMNGKKVAFFTADFLK